MLFYHIVRAGYVLSRYSCGLILRRCLNHRIQQRNFLSFVTARKFLRLVGLSQQENFFGLVSPIQQRNLWDLISHSQQSPFLGSMSPSQWRYFYGLSQKKNFFGVTHVAILYQSLIFQSENILLWGLAIVPLWGLAR